MDVFFALDENFGKHYKTLTTPFTLFGPFNGVNNLIFHDVTIKIRTQPSLRRIENTEGEYHEIASNIDCNKSSADVGAPFSVVIIFISIILSMYALFL